MFDFYNRAAGIEWDQARARIESWINSVPSEHSADIASSLKSARSQQVHSSLWHLYLNAELRSQGFEVEFEPKRHLPDGKVLNPDLIASKAGSQFVIDAVVKFERNEYSSRQSAQDSLVDSLNIQLSDHPSTAFLHISFPREGLLHRIQLSRLINRVRTWLDHGVNSGDVLKIYDYVDWEIHIRSLDFERKQGERIIGWQDRGLFHGRAVRDSTDLRDTIHQKISKYRELTLPIVIAIQVQRDFMSDRDIQFALYGGYGAREAILNNGHIKSIGGHDTKGLWVTPTGPRNRVCPAVIAVEKPVELPVMERLKPIVWINPWSEIEFQSLTHWNENVPDPNHDSGIRTIRK